MASYVSLALSDTMFPETGELTEKAFYQSLTPEQAQEWLDIWKEKGVTSALNSTHAATIAAIKERFGIELPAAKSTDPVQILLAEGDYLLVCQAFFKRRLKEGERYTQEEIDAATIKFRLWHI